MSPAWWRGGQQPGGADASPSAEPLHPAPPLAKRLNRNALTVAAVLMGLTVLTAVVMLNPSRDPAALGGAAGPGTGAFVPSRPSFLDQPAPGAGSPAAPVLSVPQAPAPVPAAEAVGAVSGIQRSGETSSRGDTRAGNAYAQFADAQAAARDRAFRGALVSPALVEGIESRASPPGSDIPARGAPLQGASGTPSASAATQPVASLPARQGSAALGQRAFLDRAGDANGRSVAAHLEPAGSPFTLRAGTVISGVLLTAINSDLPGDILGQVSRDVFDSRTQRTLLLPKGAKLVGTYDNQIAAGQGRLLVAWTRLILPDGRSMTLPGLVLKDREGKSGAADRVDHHYGRVFGNALLLSAISAGAQLSQPRQTSIFSSASAGQVAAGALGQELSSVALEILRRGMDVPPTITIRQGQPFYVSLNGDLVFDAPYAPKL